MTGGKKILFPIGTKQSTFSLPGGRSFLDFPLISFFFGSGAFLCFASSENDARRHARKISGTYDLLFLEISCVIFLPKKVNEIAKSRNKSQATPLWLSLFV
jgi:hypothetical protein